MNVYETLKRRFTLGGMTEDLGVYNGSADSESEPLLHRKCPTCNGVGRIKKEEAESFFTFVRLNDDRLKPRRLLIKVGVLVGLIASLTAVCAFFIIPRSLVITIVNCTSVENLWTPTSANFIIAVTMNVKNDNYFFADLNYTKVQVFVKTHAKLETISVLPNFSAVGMRKTQQHTLNVTITLTDVNFQEFRKWCVCVFYPRTLLLFFEVSVSGTVMTQTQNHKATRASLITCCDTHKAPPTTTTTTTATTSTTTIPPSTTTIPPTTTSTTTLATLATNTTAKAPRSSITKPAPPPPSSAPF